MVRLNELSAWTVLCGLGLGVGLWSLVCLLPRFSRPRLMARVAPYVLDVSAGARAFMRPRASDPVHVLGILLSPLFVRLAAVLAALLGGSEGVSRRLAQAGSAMGVDRFRCEQLLWTLGGLAAGTALVAVLPVLRAGPAVMQVALPPMAGLAGALFRDWLLRRAVAARLARITSELPTVLEFLTLSLSAGESMLDSLRRVAGARSGELAREFAAVITSVHAGVPLAVGLHDLSRRLQLPPLARCLDQMTAALERGAPLVEVLRAQAQDARDDAKRELLALAGKKEVAMLVPLVFLILPLTIVFAIFPGIFVLQTGL